MSRFSIRSSDDKPLSDVSTFDHVGREIRFSGYEGGARYLESDVLGDDSLRSIIHEAGLAAADPRSEPAGGSFGARTGRAARRKLNA